MARDDDACNSSLSPFLGQDSHSQGKYVCRSRAHFGPSLFDRYSSLGPNGHPPAFRLHSVRIDKPSELFDGGSM